MAIALETDTGAEADSVVTEQSIRFVTGRTIVVRGNDIDTDRIVPARYLKLVTFGGFGKYAFYDERYDEEGRRKPHPFNDALHSGASVLVVNRNFGCGSSREHAPQALMRWGIRAVVGESFAEIFSGNCAQLGIPTVTLDAEEAGRLMTFAESHPKESVSVSLDEAKIAYGGVIVHCTVAPAVRGALVGGTWDTLGELLQAGRAIEETAARLPYLRFGRKARENEAEKTAELQPASGFKGKG
jgi:3-isopropylmalate/(R)-2-methylmalate dehydratase small subunit